MSAEVKYRLVPQTKDDKRQRIQMVLSEDGSEQFQLQASSNRWRLKARRTVHVFVGEENTSTKFRRVGAWRDKKAFQIAIDAINENGLQETFPPKSPSGRSRRVRAVAAGAGDAFTAAGGVAGPIF